MDGTYNFQNQTSQQNPIPQSSNPGNQKASLVQSFLQGAIIEILIVLVGLSIIILILNYFNIIPISQNFPNYFGFLPHEAIIIKKETVSVPSPTPNMSSPSVKLRKELESVKNRAKNTALKSSILTNEFEGKITEIDTHGGINNNLKYEVKLKIQNDKGKITGWFFNKEDLNLIKIVEKRNDKEFSFDFNNLKVGDTIIITIVNDLLREDVIEIKISKV